MVNVLGLPLHAGGSGQLTAFQYAKILPVRVSLSSLRRGWILRCYRHACQARADSYPTDSQQLGDAHVTALASRPKLMAAQAPYTEDKNQEG